MTRSGKSHLTKLYLLDVLKEVENNPHAKLVVYEPKREFYSWLMTLKGKHGLRSHLQYYMPSDRRSVALDFTNDFRSPQDSVTLANAFYPVNPKENNPFWGDTFRTIYAGVYMAIKKKLGRCDMRLMCLVLEDEELTKAVLQHDAYYVQARKLLGIGGGSAGDTTRNILSTIHSRTAELKVMAAHLDMCEQTTGKFSIRKFVEEQNAGILAVSKDSDYQLAQDPMNGILFLRLMQLLDKQQQDPRRKVFIVIDEFPTLAGDNPCPGMKDMFLRLASRGVCILITYQGHTTIKGIYGDDTSGIIGQCSNVIYLRQPDPESAEYASKDLGLERG